MKCCAYCGRESSDSATFCFECGTHLDDNAVAENTETANRVVRAVIALTATFVSGWLVWVSLHQIIFGHQGSIGFSEFIAFSLPLFVYALGYFLFLVGRSSVLGRIYPKRARRWLVNYYALWALFIFLLCAGFWVVGAFHE